MFGVNPVEGYILPATESLELLTEGPERDGKRTDLKLGVEKPYLIIYENGRRNRVFLNDTPQLRQYYYDYKCFKSTTVRLESLNFALKYLTGRGMRFACRLDCA